MCATTIFLILAAYLAGNIIADAKEELPITDISNIARLIPNHTVKYKRVLTEIILKPIIRDDPQDVLSDETNATGETTVGPPSPLSNVIYTDVSEEEKAAKLFAKEFDQFSISSKAKAMSASWNYASNLTQENANILQALTEEMDKDLKARIPKIMSFNHTTFKDPLLRRQFEIMKRQGYSILPSKKYIKLIGAINKMSENYGKVRVCSYREPNKCNLQLEPELTMVLKNSDDPEEMAYYWKEWYDKAGKPNRRHFEKYLKLRNEAAVLNGYKSGAELWLSEYEAPELEKQLEAIHFQMRPLFEELHAHVRHALSVKYGNDLVPLDGPIPMHLLGNMWGQSWLHMDKIATPFPHLKLPDTTEEMIRQNYTIIDLYKMAERFFTSLGLEPMSKLFWKNSILVKPNDREIICHASAWDMSNGTDFRIKQCTRLDASDLMTVHHEMGHVVYYMLYRNQSSLFRMGANDGFHEAIGDLITLSVMTPKYLKQVGLMKEIPSSKGAKINQLFRMALEKLPALQFMYALETYRYGVFRGEIKSSDSNCAYWDGMLNSMGVKPPFKRTSEDFDPPGKYHISADIEYLRYMVAQILQFQFHKGLCTLTDGYEPNIPGKLLSDCNLFGNKDVGNILRKTLSLGSSVPWPEQLEMITGTRILDATALKEFFDPLYEHLVRSNRERGLRVGWNMNNGCE